MKKVWIFIVLICLSLQMTSCKTETKKVVTKTKKSTAYSLNTAKSNVQWTAYKTTDKIPVKGTFKTVTITKKGNGNTIKEAINNAEFSIPVSSIFSSNADRDSKLVRFFFGMMDNTELLSGKLIIENDSVGYASLTMNSLTEKLPFNYSIVDKKITLNAVMNMDIWRAKKAVDSLNAVCKDLHKAADGISKTWSDVAINITSVFK